MEYSRPTAETVNPGSTRHTEARATTVDSAAPVPVGLKLTSRCRSAPTSSAMPTMPLRVIMIAANTVSRAYVDAPSPPPAISMTMRPTSMTVTATARTSDP